ncbi:tonB-dependent Receptor Plug domain protein, partial [Bacteroides fragilis str. 3397 T10]
EDAQTLDEVTVVAVGYGDVRRRDLTGAIGSANIGDLTKSPMSNITGSLGGRIAGVQVTSSDGGPGDNYDIVIRGVGSLTGSTSPLYVIDGFPSETSGLSSLDPNDIESIDILKDASATAIYGARGANGVVIITTKKGTAGKPTVTYNGSLT